MTAVTARHTQVKEVFAAACLEPPTQRFAFLARNCGGDEAVRREVESLLAFYLDDQPIPGTRARSRRAAGPHSRYRRGQVLAGRYRIERPLGAGGMGEVYAVYDGMLRETVALKILYRSDALLRQRLVDEVRLARQVTHPAVCRVYDMGDDAGTPFLTMELIEGEDLASRLERSGPLPSAEVVEIAQRLAAALAAAHDAGVLHRDLKPSNILVARKGGLYITDFGIATSGGQKHKTTHDREPHMLGTPAYMAPEESERGGVVTERSDLYSLGLILYELVTGALAFDAADLDTLLAMQRSSVPEPPSRLVPDIDPTLEALILGLMAKDPAKRPASARSILAALAGTAAAPIETSPTTRATERRLIVALVCSLEAPPAVMAEPGWPALVRIFQARATASCRLKGGRVHRHFADGLVVHFGVQMAAEMDSESAVRAGLEIVADLQQRPLLAPERGDVSARVMVAAVSALIRGNHVVTSERTLERTMGPEATAHRESRSDPAVVTVAESMLPLLRGAFTVDPVHQENGERRFRITGAREGLGLKADASRLTPLANRSLDLAHLERWWRDASEGRGQAVLLSGEAGIGKSRIVHELWQRVGPGSSGLEARCSSFHPNTPLHPFVRMVAHAAGIEDADSGVARATKLRATLTALGPRAEELLAVFSAWLSTSDAPALTASGGASEADRRHFIEALDEWILSLAESKPLLLVVEDVHWSDPTSREAVETLIDLVRMARVLLVVTFRPSFTPPWNRTDINHLVLQPLAPDEARTLVAAMPQGEVREAGPIVDRADGNPLFLEELTLHEHEARASSHLEVPGSLHGLLAARLDRLGSAKRIAQAAAVCGRTFSYVMLEALTGTEADRPGLDAGLARLLDAEILFQRGPLRRAAFSWKHALLREAAYESVPARERRLLHERAARALLELEPTNCALHPQEVASHWTEAGHHQEALEWWRRAGLRALERSAYEESDRLFDRALRSLRRTPNNADRRRRELDLRLALTSLEMGRHGPASAQAARQAGKADKLCAGLPLDDEVARAILLSARVRFARGEMRRTLRILEPLRAFDDRIQSSYLRASVLTQAANLLSSLGRLDESDHFQGRAIEAYGTATERPAGVLTTDPLAHLLITRASNEWLRGRAGESTRLIDQAIAHTERLGHPFSRAMVLVLAASLSMRRRDWARFRALIDDATGAAAAVRSYWLIDMCNVMAPLADGSLDPAARAERLRAALAVPPGTRLYRSVPMSELADLLAAQGHEDEARQVMDNAATEARRWDIGLLPDILRRRGELAARLGRLKEAEAELRRGVRAARHRGVLGLELHCVVSLARLLDATGRRAAARRALVSLLARVPPDVDAPERAEAENLLRDLHG